MIAVLSAYPLVGRLKSIYDRILRYTGAADEFHLYTDLADVPETCKTVIFFGTFDGTETTRYLGRYIPIQKARGYRFVIGERTFIPTYAPIVLNGRPNYFPVCIWDFKTAKRTGGKPAPQFPQGALTLHPDPEKFREWCAMAAASELVSVDLETPGKKEKEDIALEDIVTTIVRASLAYGPGGDVKAITFPWIEPFITIVKEEILDDPCEKIFWNGWHFDIPILRQNNMDPTRRGRIIDGMYLYHFLQPTLPKGLGAVTTLYADVPEWKSLNNDEPELYSAMDAWASHTNFYGIRAALRARGTWDLAVRHVIELQHLLDDMSRRGVNVHQKCEVCPEDVTADCCLARFNDKCDVKLAELRGMLNEHPDIKPLRKFHPENGYVRTPKDTTGLIEREFEVGGVDAVCTCITDAPDQNCPHCEGSGMVPIREVKLRWAKHLDFLPTSEDQVKAYFDSKGYEYSNADEKTISNLYRKHKDSLLLDFITYRQQKKDRGTYGGIPIGRDGKVHTTFTLKPDTHRLSSVAPNLQNQTADFKHVYIPSPGCKLVEVDLSSVEAVLTGFFAGDAEYIRRAKIGIHKIAMAVYLGEKIDFSWPDPQIKGLVKDIGDRDKKLYRKIKSVIYGGNYLAGKRTIYKNNPGDFASEKEAGLFLRFCQSLSPLVPAWQRRTVEQAQRSHGLTNPFGYYKALWGHEDGPAACAFLPQSTVAAIMKEIMLDLPAELKSYLILQVHDSLVFDIPEQRMADMIPQIHQAFDRAWPQLNNLKIGYEMKTGDTLAFH